LPLGPPRRRPACARLQAVFPRLRARALRRQRYGADADSLQARKTALQPIARGKHVEVDTAVRLLDAGIRDVLHGEPHAEAWVELQADAEMGAELQRTRQAVVVIVDGVRQQVDPEACLDISLRRCAESALRSPDRSDIQIEPARDAATVGNPPD